jgi:acetoacetyl-CoA synthetase
MTAITEGTPVWAPSPAVLEANELTRYTRWLEHTRQLRFRSYEALWGWSVTELETFWRSVWEFFDIRASAPYERVLSSRAMPGARWFEGAKLNYAEHAFRHATDARPALVTRSELRPTREVSWRELADLVGALAARLRAAGVRPGDRVVSYMPNIVETCAALFACASVGAVWSSCSPDMGPGAVLDRFRQIEPKVLFAVDGYRYGGRDFDRTANVKDIVAALPTLVEVIVVPYLGVPGAAASIPKAVTWDAAVAAPAPLAFEQVPFEHPLWVVYSSGTTGLPKGIVHGHGGIILEHLKSMALQHDMRPGDRFLWMSSTGWIVWNMLVSGLLAGCVVCLFDGNPAWPTADALWRFAAEQRVNHFGCGAAFVFATMKAGVEPAKLGDFAALRSINVTGSPLTADAYAWAYAHVKPDFWLNSISGGTDVACGFLVGAPTLPVTAGELQCRALGVAAYAFDETGKPVTDQVGELVITAPMPSMPLRFWNDPDDRRYRESYFEMYPGVWRHGDWIRITARGTAVIYGRSDTTINRHGIRMGTAEIYRVVEELPEVLDSLVVDLEYLGRPSFMPLFVVLRPGHALDDALKDRIKAAIRAGASSRHVPNEIYAVPEIPRTLTGKKMELPVRKLLLGMTAEKVASPEAMQNPGSFATFVALAGVVDAAREGQASG